MVPTEIESFLLERLSQSCQYLTFIDLIRLARSEIGADRQMVARTVKRLLCSGSLTYAQQLGRTVLAISYQHGRKVTDRICLAAETDPIQARTKTNIVLRLSAGASFGSGDHPTTRLALKAIDDLFEKKSLGPGAKILDVGTGSGILAIAALLLGADNGVGIDIDPCALWEARRNAHLNGLGGRLIINDIPLPSLKGEFDLILANLRRPSLERFSSEFRRLLKKKGLMVITGIRPEERDELLQSYRSIGLAPRRESTAQGWMALVLGPSEK